MAPRITITCTRCGARLVTASVQEMAEWNTSHDAVCLGPTPRPIKEEP